MKAESGHCGITSDLKFAPSYHTVVDFTTFLPGTHPMPPEGLRPMRSSSAFRHTKGSLPTMLLLLCRIEDTCVIICLNAEKDTILGFRVKEGLSCVFSAKQ